ncbi:MAG: hypothetical protein JJLCMIEE_03026 [Acidimicrobiales bacterium]|nr:MAG: hypothetical protein EDR02_07755 [Actinomycetota bacterium]MBV6509910.1 hypothetical protein [Acidimicrobiales bacterium]RIK08597.1 MAG: hypothetical protein DCC48_01250 [Acidobacteriota bacterium]
MWFTRVMGSSAGTNDFASTAHTPAPGPARRSDIEVIFDEPGPPLGGIASPPGYSSARRPAETGAGDLPDPGEFSIRAVVKILDITAIATFFYWLLVVMGTVDRMNRIDAAAGIWDFLAVPLDYAPALLVSVVALSAAAIIRLLARRCSTDAPR